MHTLVLFFLIIASGFVASGVIASGFMLFTRKTSIETAPSSESLRLAAVGLTIFTGPVILASNALRARGTDQPPAYLALALSISAAWSFVLGLFFVSVAIAIPSPF